MKQTEFIELLREMPIFGTTKKKNKSLEEKIEQYLTVLIEWYLKVEEQL